MHVDELLRRSRRREQLVAAGRHLAEARADREHEVGAFDARRELGIDADADVAGVVRMAVVEHVLEAERAADRQRARLRRSARALRTPRAVQPLPPTITNGRSAAASSSPRRAIAAAGGAASAGSMRGSTGALVDARSMSSGKREDDRTRSPLHRDVERARDVLGQAVGVADLADPLGEAERAGAEHVRVVDFLERLAVALVARDLADEQHHRRRVLERGVQADRRVARARSARDEAQSRAAGELALRLGHVARAALVPAADEADPVAVLVEAVEGGEEALAGDAEHRGRALREQRFHERVAGGTRRWLRIGHGRARSDRCESPSVT